MAIERKFVYAAVGATAIILLALIIFSLSLSRANPEFKYARCDKTGACLDGIQISACPDYGQVERCVIKRGVDFTCNLDFTARK